MASIPKTVLTELEYLQIERLASGNGLLREFNDPSDFVQLACMDRRLKLSDIYFKKDCARTNE